MITLRSLTIVFLVSLSALSAVMPDPLLSPGRQADPTANALSEIRAAERRRVPIEVSLKAFAKYTAGGPVEVTVIVTNLFDTPLLVNTRMLVNHFRLPGELSFAILDPDGKRVEIQRLITPLSIREEDFTALQRGESLQRTVDLSDLFNITRKGSYVIQVDYHNDVDQTDQSLHAWKGIVRSEPVVIVLE